MSGVDQIPQDVHTYLELSGPSNRHTSGYRHRGWLAYDLNTDLMFRQCRKNVLPKLLLLLLRGKIREEASQIRNPSEMYTDRQLLCRAQIISSNVLLIVCGGDTEDTPWFGVPL